MDIGISLLGLLVGFLVGLTGVGGAAILTPLLVMIGIQPSIAVGTDLMYNSITKLFGTIQHFRQKTIHYKLVFYFAAGSIPGAIVAVVLIRLFSSFFHNQENLMRMILGSVLVVVALATLLRQLFDRKLKASRLQEKPLEQKKLLTVSIGFILGVVVGLTSIGSGSLFALALIYLYRMSAAQVVGTDIAHALLLVSVASFLHASLGNVNYTLVANLLIGSIPGVLLGSTLSSKVPSRPLRALVALLILIGGIKLI